VIRLNVHVFVLITLQMFDEVIFCGAADMIPVFKFSPHFDKQIERNLSYLSSHFWQCSSQWKHIHSILNLLPKENNLGELRWVNETTK